MANYPQSSTGLAYITYPVGPASDGLTVTSSASINTKGSYTQIVASSPFACNYMVIEVVRTTAATGRQYLLDIATGAAASETVIIPNLLAESTNTNTSFGGNGLFHIPCEITAGSRISARCASTTGSSACVIAVTLIAAGDTPGIASFVSYGANTADSGGTSLDPGGTINTKGAYSQLTASTSTTSQWLMLMATIGGNAAPQSATWSIDIATGTAASEVVLIPDLRFNYAGGATPANMFIPRAIGMLTYIPAGTRIAARASCNINDATDRLIDVALIAGTAPSESGSTDPERSFVFVG